MINFQLTGTGLTITISEGECSKTAEITIPDPSGLDIIVTDSYTIEIGEEVLLIT